MSIGGAASDVLSIDLLMRARSEGTGAFSDMENHLGGIGKSLALVSAAAVAGGVALVGAGVVAVKMAADFQASMTQLVTGAGESQANLQLVSNGILNMAGQVGESTTQLAQGMFMIESAGFHGAAGLDVLKAAAEGAKVGNADLQTTADAVTTVMKDYGMGAGQAADATNFLVSVVSQGKTHMQDLAGSLVGILPTASALHIPLEQVGGAMATLTARGVPAADAATYLRFTISSLTAETPKGAKALEGIGLSAKEVGDTLTTKGLLPALQEIEEHLSKKFPQGGADMFAALKDITGGTRGLGAALGLTGDNLDTFVAATQNVASQMGGAKGQVMGWNLAQEDFNTQMDKAKGGLEAFSIRIGQMLLPFATQALGVFANWAGVLTDKVLPAVQNDVIPALQKMGGWIADNLLPVLGQLGKFITDTVVPAAQSFGQWFGDHVLPVLQNVAGFIGGTVIPALQQIGQHIVTDVLPVLEQFGNFIISTIINPLVTVAEHVIPPLLTAIDWIAQHFQALEPFLVAVGGFIATMWAVDKIQAWSAAATTAIEGVIGKFTGLAGAATAATGAEAAAVAGTGAAGEIGAVGEAGLLANPIAIIAAGVAAPLAAWAVVLQNQISTNEQEFNDLNRRGDQAAQSMGLGAQNLATLTNFLQSGGQTLEDTFANFTTTSAFTALNSQQQSSLMSDLTDEISSGKVKSVNSLLDFVTNWAALAQSSKGAIPSEQSVEQAIADTAAKMPKLMQDLIDNFSKLGTNAGKAATNADNIANDLGVAAGDLSDFGTRISGLASGITSALGYAQSHAQDLQNAMSQVHIPATPTPSGGGPFPGYGPGGATGGKFAGPYGTFLGHAQGGGKYFSEGWVHVGEGATNPEWVINGQQAGSFAPLLDALVFGGASQASPASGGGGTSSLVPLLGAPSSDPVTIALLTSIDARLAAIQGTPSVSAAQAAMRTGA